MSERVAAIVVTYNRKVLLGECLDALLAQTRPVDKIILIDNASTDRTPEFLKEHGYLDRSVLDYVRLPENTGGAGGFYEGVKRGYEAGYDWLWLMDDDAEPLLNALEKMTPAFAMDSVMAVANLKVDALLNPLTGHRGWVNLCRKDGNILKKITANELAKTIVEIGHASFVGLAVSRIAVDRIGYPKKEFFIHHDDVEYCMRIASVGKIIMLNKSIIKHKEASKKDGSTMSFMGRSSDRIPLDKLWLRYYGARNLVWLKKRHCSKGNLLFFMFNWYLKKCLAIVLYDDDHKWIRLSFYIHILLDGWYGRFDNEKPRRILSNK